MNETSSQRKTRFRPGFRGWVGTLAVGVICGALLPIVPLVASATACGMGMLCFLVDHSPWVAGITAVAGFIGGMFITYKLAEHSHKKKLEEQPLRPEMTLDQRQHEARMAWLNNFDRHRR